MKKITILPFLLLTLYSCKSQLVLIETNVPSILKINDEEYSTPVEIDLRMNKEYTIMFYADGYYSKDETVIVTEQTTKLFIKLEKTIEQIEKEKQEKYDRLTKNLTVKNNLKVYEEPHRLSKSTIIPDESTIDILSRSKWFEYINKKESFWLKIKYKDSFKWIRSSEFNSRIDYSVVQEEDIEKIKIDSLIENGTRVNNEYENKNLKIMSLPNPINEPNTDEKVIFYTDYDYKICLYNYPKPRKEIEIKLISESGFNLAENLSINGFEIDVITEDPFTGFPLNKHITTIDYFPFATYSDRNWIIQFRIDDNNYEEKITLPYNQFSISNSDTPEYVNIDEGYC